MDFHDHHETPADFHDFAHEQRSDPFVAPSEAVYLSKDIAVVRPSIVFGKGIRDEVSDGVEEAGKRKPASERATNR